MFMVKRKGKEEGKKQKEKRIKIMRWTARTLSVLILLFSLPFYFGYGNPLPFVDPDYSFIENFFLTIVPVMFFGLFIVFIMIWGFELTSYLNPMNGYKLIWFPMNSFLSISFILLLVVIICSIFIYRPFCRYICPFEHYPI